MSSEIIHVLGSDRETYAADLPTAQRWVTDGRITRQTQIYDPAAGRWVTAGDIAALFPRQPPVNTSGRAGGIAGSILVALFIGFGIIALIFAIFAATQM